MKTWLFLGEYFETTFGLKAKQTEGKHGGHGWRFLPAGVVVICCGFAVVHQVCFRDLLLRLFIQQASKGERLIGPDLIQALRGGFP